MCASGDERTRWKVVWNGRSRADAENITVPQAKQILLEVAASYERLADTLDANANRPKA
ncbi:MAG TPA: hypothetical protein VK629_06585 [Steroidobacteraceae bacterium]|nr:hypothetical protein [Steroidobacteraceae bacterium]